MRKVIVSKYIKNNVPEEEIGEAIFHQFGVDFDELESGTGNFSTAIIEWPDGRLDNVYIKRVRFINDDKPELSANFKLALQQAIEAIYFDDNSDYKSALWEIVKHLGGEEAFDLLQNDRRAAFVKYGGGDDKPINSQC